MTGYINNIIDFVTNKIKQLVDNNDIDIKIIDIDINLVKNMINVDYIQKNDVDEVELNNNLLYEYSQVNIPLDELIKME